MKRNLPVVFGNVVALVPVDRDAQWMSVLYGKNEKGEEILIISKNFLKSEWKDAMEHIDECRGGDYQYVDSKGDVYDIVGGNIVDKICLLSFAKAGEEVYGKLRA